LQPHFVQQYARHLRIVGQRLDVGGKQLQLLSLALLVEDLDCLQPPRLGGMVQLTQITERSLPRTVRRSKTFSPNRVTGRKMLQEGWSALHRLFQTRRLQTHAVARLATPQNRQNQPRRDELRLARRSSGAGRAELQIAENEGNKDLEMLTAR